MALRTRVRPRERERRLTRTGNLHELRRKEALRPPTALTRMDLDPHSLLSLTEQLRKALSRHSVSVLNVFWDWDVSGSGMVCFNALLPCRAPSSLR